MGTPDRFTRDSLCPFDDTTLSFVASTDIKNEFGVEIFVQKIIIEIVRFRRFRENHIPIVGFACYPRCVIRFVLNIEIVRLVQDKVVAQQAVVNQPVEAIEFEFYVVVKVVFAYDVLDCCSSDYFSRLEK